MKPRIEDIHWFEKQIQRIKDKNLSRITTYIFNYFKDDYLIIPGSINKLHHEWDHGEFDHVKEMIEFYDLLKPNLVKNYPHIQDLIISGVLIHDIEKCTRFFYENKEWNKKQGHPLGHFEFPAEVVIEACKELKISYKLETVQRLTHILRSHHGDTSVVAPNSMEARIVALLDYLSAKLSPHSIWGIDVNFLPHDVVSKIEKSIEKKKQKKEK